VLGDARGAGHWATAANCHNLHATLVQHAQPCACGPESYGSEQSFFFLLSVQSLRSPHAVRPSRVVSVSGGEAKVALLLRTVAEHARQGLMYAVSWMVVRCSTVNRCVSTFLSSTQACHWSSACVVLSRALGCDGAIQPLFSARNDVGM
jgi:hypothetical protein